MNILASRYVQCPYCGEMIEVLIDCSIAQQEYIEDCQICCRPICFKVRVEQTGNIFLCVTHENE